jgi:hypothetical protein
MPTQEIPSARSPTVRLLFSARSLVPLPFGGFADDADGADDADAKIRTQSFLGEIG